MLALAYTSEYAGLEGYSYLAYLQVGTGAPFRRRYVGESHIDRMRGAEELFSLCYVGSLDAFMM